MQPMRLCLFLGREFEGTFENAQWRKVKQMQPMWLYLFSGTEFEGSFENAQWRKIKQMQRMRLWILNKSKTNATNMHFSNEIQISTQMWLYLFSGPEFEGSFENAQWRKVKQMQRMRLWILL